MRIVLHIGWRKTGTSTIQYLLDASRQFLRERDRINYPQTALIWHAHHVAAWKLLGRKRGASREGTFRDMLSEDDEQLPSRLAETFNGHEVAIIAYVRRQDRYIESRYNQHVKSTRRLMANVSRFAQDQLGALDYYEQFRRWAAAFGRENLEVRIYDRAGFRGGDVRLDFLDALGIDERGLSFDEGMSNVSLGYSAVQFLRRFNAIPHTGIQRRMVLRLLEQRDRRHPEHTSFFSPEERCAIMERFRESNRRFAKEFLGLDDVFELTAEELAAEAALDRTYGEKRFREMLAVVLPRLAKDERDGQ
jgi:hypothetical protein